MFRYNCRQLPPRCDGRVAHGAGFCGCCLQCIKQISIGDPCAPSGLCPGPSECKESLYCDPDQRACLPFPMPSSEETRSYNDTTPLRYKLEPPKKETWKPNLMAS
ncbi:hypothetical protein MTO96_026154 [Rhipicephalus appendiculatus]